MEQEQAKLGPGRRGADAECQGPAESCNKDNVRGKGGTRGTVVTAWVIAFHDSRHRNLRIREGTVPTISDQPRNSDGQQLCLRETRIQFRDRPRRRASVTWV